MNNKLLDKDFIKQIKILGRKWKKSPKNICINKEQIKKWDELIEEWSEDESVPLVIRKSGNNRGKEIKHKKTGRTIIMTDNSFSHWIFYQVRNEKICPKLINIKNLLYKDEIPFVFIIPKKDKNKYDRKTPLGKYAISREGFKLCHIEPVGIQKRENVKEMNIDILKEHFKKLAKPSNMFVVPSVLGGLGEIKEFIEEQKNNPHF